MSEKFFLDMSENEQLEFIKKYVDEHKDMTQHDREEFYNLIREEKKGEYNKRVFFFLSDKVYKAILKNIGFECEDLILTSFFGYAWVKFINDNKIVANRKIKNKIVESKIIDEEKFFRFFKVFLERLDNFQKGYLQAKIIAFPGLFYMFPADIQNKLNECLNFNFEVKTDLNKIEAEKIYSTFNKFNKECCYDVTGDGQCSTRAVNMGYRIFKSDYFKDKKVKDDMTYDQCVELRKEAYKLTGEEALAAENYRAWMDPKYILGYFYKRDKENGNGSIPWVRLGWSSGSGFNFTSGNLEKDIFTSILDGCIVIGNVNKNHAVCLKEDYETRKKYLIGLCDLLRDMVIANLLYRNHIMFSKNIVELAAKHALAVFKFNFDSSVLSFSSDKNEENKISEKLNLVLGAFSNDQKYFLCIRFLEFMYDEYKKTLEENKWNEMTFEKIINELIPKFKKEIIDKDKNIKKTDYGLTEKDFFVDLPDGCKTIFEVEKELLSVRSNYEACNRKSLKNRRRNILNALETGLSVGGELSQKHFNQRKYLQKRVNDYYYLFYTLDEEQIEMFLGRGIFPLEKFDIYNDRPDIQILALENIYGIEERKKILSDAFEKDNNFFAGCADDVKKKLIDLDIIPDEELKNFYNLFFEVKEIEEKDDNGETYIEKEFIYRPENLEKQLEALDNMDEDFRRRAINKFCDYTGKCIYDFMEDEKCFGDELKKKIAQKRFIELNEAHSFKSKVFNLVFNEKNLTNFNNYDIDVLKKLYDVYDDGYSNSECKRLLEGHKLFVLNNNQKAVLPKLGINIFIDNNIDVANEMSTGKDKSRTIYNDMYKNTDYVSGGGCYAKAAFQSYKREGSINWSLSENKKELQNFIDESKVNSSEDGFWGYGDKAMKFLSKKHGITTVCLCFDEYKHLTINKYNTNSDLIDCSDFEDLKDIAYAILDGCPTTMHNYSANHFQNLSCNEEKREKFVYNMFDLYMNERMREITSGDGFGLGYILGFFGVYGDDDDGDGDDGVYFLGLLIY